MKAMRWLGKGLTLAAVMSVGAVTVGCGGGDDAQDGQNATEETAEAIDAVGQEAADAAEKAADEVEQATNDAADKTKQAAEDAQN